jgi:hypothetical protein
LIDRYPHPINQSHAIAVSESFRWGGDMDVVTINARVKALEAEIENFKEQNRGLKATLRAREEVGSVDLRLRTTGVLLLLAWANFPPPPGSTPSPLSPTGPPGPGLLYLRLPP